MNADLEELHAALLDLSGLLNSPRQDVVLLDEAGVSLDRALFPILSRVGALGAPTIDLLAELVGRDQSTVSRQVTKLEQLGLIARRVSEEDNRCREVVVTERGDVVLKRIRQARNALLKGVLRDWSETEQQALVNSLRHFVASVRMAVKEHEVADD